jgi:hypothetical protein
MTNIVEIPKKNNKVRFLGVDYVDSRPVSMRSILDILNDRLEIGLSAAQIGQIDAGLELVLDGNSAGRLNLI